jgi:hypothetical protein
MNGSVEIQASPLGLSPDCSTPDCDFRFPAKRSGGKSCDKGNVYRARHVQAIK